MIGVRTYLLGARGGWGGGGVQDRSLLLERFPMIDRSPCCSSCRCSCGSYTGKDGSSSFAPGVRQRTCVAAAVSADDVFDGRDECEEEHSIFFCECNCLSIGRPSSPSL